MRPGAGSLADAIGDAERCRADIFEGSYLRVVLLAERIFRDHILEKEKVLGWKTSTFIVIFRVEITDKETT